MSAHFKHHRDDEGVDRIEIVATPRYKTSELSGDEWRVSANVKFYRKGKLVGERDFSKMEWAIMCLGQMWAERPEMSPVALWGLDSETCAQFSCQAPAVIVYRLKKEFASNGEGPLPTPYEPYKQPMIAFCDKHKRRGDAGREDADDNYEVVT